LAVGYTNPARAPVRAQWARRLLLAAAEIPEISARLPRGGWSANIRVAGDRELRRLNGRFLGEDHATDVLSFPSGDTAEGFLGDIVISWPAVCRQAEEFGHPRESEFALLAIHGFLHLLGWDHQRRSAAARMNRVQLAALAAAGVSIAGQRLAEGGAPPG
jgi:probable rRNA maturation factor